MTTWEPRDKKAAPAPAAASSRPRTKAPLIAGVDLPSVHVPFAAVIAGIAAAGMLGLLALNVHIQNQAFALRASQKEAAALGLQVSELQTQVYAKAAPGALAAAASELGMVINPYPNFVDLRTGAVTGKKAADGTVPGLDALNPTPGGQGSSGAGTQTPPPTTAAPTASESSTSEPASSEPAAAPTSAAPATPQQPATTKVTGTPKPVASARADTASQQATPAARG